MNRIVGTSLLLVVALSACENVTLIPRVAGIRDASDLELPPMALTFQKRGQFGHTDYNQRKEDMIECGIPREEYEDNLYAFRGRNPGETTEQFDARRESFLRCIKGKDYLWLGLEECGPVKENRGICK
jgi:hypothetical protein